MDVAELGVVLRPGDHPGVPDAQPRGQPAVRRARGPDPLRLVRLRRAAVRHRRRHHGRRLGGYNPTTSDSYLLPVFASVFLGTAIFEPGRFNPLGTWVGIYFLATGILGLQLLGLQAWVSPVFYGGVLVIAVTISTLLRRRAS
jgi:hypothetical protein